MARRPAVRETAVGTAWRTVRSFLLFVIVVGVVFALYSAGVAVSTADKCSGTELHAAKTWNYFPPRWDCVPGQG